MYGMRSPMRLPRALGCFHEVKAPWSCSEPDQQPLWPGCQQQRGQEDVWLWDRRTAGCRESSWDIGELRKD